MNKIDWLKLAKDRVVKTLGEERVRTEFNPSADSIVDHIKQKTAELINTCEELKNKDARLASLALTYYEKAAIKTLLCGQLRLLQQKKQRTNRR